MPFFCISLINLIWRSSTNKKIIKICKKIISFLLTVELAIEKIISKVTVFIRIVMVVVVVIYKKHELSFMFLGQNGILYPKATITLILKNDATLKRELVKHKIRKTNDIKQKTTHTKALDGKLKNLIVNWCIDFLYVLFNFACFKLFFELINKNVYL